MPREGIKLQEFDASEWVLCGEEELLSIFQVLHTFSGKTYKFCKGLKTQVGHLEQMSNWRLWQGSEIDWGHIPRHGVFPSMASC